MLKQILAVTRISLRSLPQRLGPSLVAAIGVAGVVAVFVAMLSIAAGVRATMDTAGSDDLAIVLRSGSESEMTSGLTQESTRIIADAPGLATDANGRALASAELFVIINLPKRGTGTDANVPLRGVQSEAFDVRENVEIIEGRRFEPGRNEVVIGAGALREFAVDLGSTLELGQSRWTVVGVFSAGGAVEESELWCDAKVLQPAYRRGNSFQSVYARLESAEAFTTFKDALTSDPRLDVDVFATDTYYAQQSQTLTGLVSMVGGVVAFLMGLGAIFGALITMYSAVASRSTEIATLRALGFTRVPVVISILLESLVLAALGGVLGGVLAYFGFNGYQAATMNWQTFSQITFAFAVTPELLVQGIVYALAIGLLGGLLPAIQAARQPVATALRGT